jgi:hypothetical protein
LTVSVIDGFCSCALLAFIAVRVVTKSAMVRWSETKCRPARPPSVVSKSRRRMIGLPPRRARAEGDRHVVLAGLVAAQG